VSKVIEPGAVLGVLGSGQLGRMFAIAARRMGYRVHVYSPDHDTPTGQVADLETSAKYDDLEAIEVFSKSVDVVTFEFENVPLATVEAVANHVPVRPNGQVLHTTQNRIREKTFLQDHGFPVAKFHVLRNESDLAEVPEELIPGVLKTAAWGYDGKGQARIGNREELASHWKSMNQDTVLEQLVPFEMEFSVVAVRSSDGDIHCYDPIENIHTNHILDISLCPGRLSQETSDTAKRIACNVLGALDVVGVMCIEFFLIGGSDIVINELAPRPHNSGHLTIDAHIACQFEQQVRSICGLPLGSTALLRPVAMANLLGDVWNVGTPPWARSLEDPDVKLHLYGKSEPRIGRKMGHLTATAASVDEALEKVKTARQRLQT